MAWLRAAAEAGTVGGLADWFAVVALFRHPLGVPIPHTAVIPRSKEGLGANLTTFVEQNFLAEGQVEERLADPAHVERFGAWLVEPGNADRVTGHLAAVLAAGLDSVDEDDVVARMSASVRARLQAFDLGPVAGRAVETSVREGRHAAMVSATFDGLREAVVRNRTTLRRRLGEQSPSWVPELVDDLVFERGEQVVRTFLTQLAEDEDHELRQALDRQALELAARLQTDAEVGRRLTDAVDRAVDDELLDRWLRAWWRDLRSRVARAADADGGTDPVRAAGRDALTSVGRRLQDRDDDVHRQAVAALQGVAPRLADAGHREIGHLIRSTVDRWDAEDTSRRLELWLGRDLQFVRINGTVVGALVGLVLHGVARVLG